jgi:iodotyrosine deiodinase
MEYPHIPLPTRPRVSSSLDSATAFYEQMKTRRSVRFFSPEPVSEETIRACISAAGTAPSGANKQPWRFIAIKDPAIKSQLRAAAEAEEREFYARRATPQWLADLAPLGTDEHKPFLEIAPWLIVVCKCIHTDPDESGNHGKTYYLDESVGIATGMLITAIHLAGLVTLTHTPSPMGFLTKLLNRPAHERAFLLLPVGYPAQGATVPDITRKPIDEIMVVV